MSSKSQYTRLQSGIAQRGILQENEWNFYIYESIDESDVDISITNYSGNPDLYIATQPLDKLDPKSTAEWK